MRRLMLSGGLVSALVVLALAAAGRPSAAQAKSVLWQRYDVDITVQANGDLRVVETQEIDFRGGPFTTGFAVIPLENTDGIFDVGVSEQGRKYAAGAAGEYTYRVQDDGRNFTVEWYFPQVADETRTYNLSYTVRGAVRQYESGDKIRYLVIPTDFEFPILRSQITVHLPPGGPLIDNPDSVGAKMEWTTSADSLTVTYANVQTIQPGEGAGIQLVFQHGAVTGPPPSWQAEYDRAAYYDERVRPLADLGFGTIAALMLVAAPGGLYLIWYLFGRDPKAGLVPEYIADPPSELSPGLVGVLVDERADMRDVTATLIDFGRRGFVELEEQATRGGLGTTKQSYLLRKKGQPPKLLDYEKRLYDAVFAGAEERDLGKLPATFFTRLPGIESAMYAAAEAAGLFRSHPERVRGSYRTGGLVLLGLVIAGGCFLTPLLSSISGVAVCLFVPPALFGIGLMALSGAMPARTRKGAEEAAKWKAFQKYLGNIQKYRDMAAAGVAEQFEKFLPYAVAFGLERRWVNAFAQAPNVFVPVPIWYRPLPVGRGVPGTLAAPAGGAPAQMPGLNQVGEGLVGGLNSVGDGLINALNTAGRSFSTPPYTYSGGGSRGFSGGGSFRGGGGFRSGGFSGGGSRGFR